MAGDDEPVADRATDGSEESGQSTAEIDRAAADADLPADVIREAERLTRLARDAIDERERSAYRERRDGRVEEHGYRARVREDDPQTVLVLHPAEWVEDGVVRVNRIEDRSRAVEIPLDGPGDPDDWAALDERNREVAREVRARHGETHGDNAEAFADYMSNHHARPIESATRAEIEEFLAEYFVRNAWPSAAQRRVVEKSVQLVFETAGVSAPPFRDCSRRSR